MEKFESYLEKERELYRELFINAEKTFKNVLNNLKSDFSCNKCCTCCKIRYSQLPPEEIYRLSVQENDPVAKKYIQFFLPYGADKDFVYSQNSNITSEENNKKAASLKNKANSSYAQKILSKHTEEVYFYFCKYLNENNECGEPDKKYLCSTFPNSITTILPENCNFINWQKIALHRIKNEIAPEIELKKKELISYKNKFKCKRTGICCRLASSEFSYEELKQKANNNDEFARQFTGIFQPYRDIQEAREIFPEYVDFLIEKYGKDGKLNFYRCKHLKGVNECPIYEKRPQICRDFPDDPLSIIPPLCGYYEWKEEVSVAAYTFHAMKQIYSFYAEKLEKALF